MIDEVTLHNLLGRIARILNVPQSEMTEEKRLHEDLNADSLDRTEIIKLLEVKLNIEISNAEAEQIKTVGDIIRLIRTH